MAQRHQSTWSKLSPVPTMHYHPQSASHIVYWNGVGMVRSTALILLGSWWGVMWPTPKMQEKSYDEFIKAYRLGAFGDVMWNEVIPSNPKKYFALITKWVTANPETMPYLLKEQYSFQEALAWFKTSNETVIED